MILRTTSEIEGFGWCYMNDPIPTKPYFFSLRLDKIGSDRGMLIGIFNEKSMTKNAIMNSYSLLYNPLGKLWNGKTEKNTKSENEGSIITLYIDISTKIIVWLSGSELVKVTAIPEGIAKGKNYLIIYLWEVGSCVTLM